MRILLLILSLIPFLAAGPAEAQIPLPSIKNKLIELALDQISTPGSFEVTVGSIESLEGGITSLVDLQVADDRGVWLITERLNFAWEPDMLLSGELVISRLELIGVTVLRPPSDSAEVPELKPDAVPDRGLFDWPRAPIALTVGEVRLERVRIAEGVLPQAIAFDASGRAFDKGDIQELGLSLHRSDAVAGRIEIAMRRDFAANTVKLDLTAEEAPGGMVAAAAGLPPDVPARLRLSADGPPEDWRLDLDAAIERVFSANGQVRLSYAERISTEADLSVTAGSDLSKEAAAILGERAMLKLQLAEQEDGRFELRAAELNSPALTATASGVLATRAGDSDLTVSLEALSPLATLVEGVAFDRFRFDGKVTGPFGGIAADGRISLAGLATPSFDAAALSLDGRVTQTASGWGFGVAGDGSGVRIDRIGSEVIGPATLSVNGALAGDTLSLERSEIASRALTASLSGKSDLAGSDGRFKLQLSAPDLAPVAAAYDIEARGALVGAADLTLSGVGAQADVLLELSALSLDGLSANRATLNGSIQQRPDGLNLGFNGATEALAVEGVPPELTREPVTYELAGHFANGALALQRFVLAAAFAEAHASGDVGIEAGTLALDYSLSARDLASLVQPFGVDARGGLRATGRAEGPFSAPRLAGEATLTGAGFERRELGTATLTHDVVLGTVTEGTLALSATDAELGDISVSTPFRLTSSEVTADPFTARALGVDTSGRLTFGLETGLVDGAVKLSSSNLASVGRFAGIALSGSARGQVGIKAAGGRQDVAAKLGFADLALDGTMISGADISLDATDALGSPRIGLRLDGRGVRAGDVSLDSLQARVDGPLDALSFSAEAKGKLSDAPLSGTLAGKANASGPAVLADIARGEVTIGPDRILLRQPMRLAAREGGVSLTGIDLALPGDARLSGDAARYPDGYAGALRLDRLSIETVERRFELPVASGQINARATFDTRPTQAKADISLEGRGLQTSGSQGPTEGMDLRLGAAWDGARLNARAEVSGDFGEPLKSRISFPLRPGPSGIPQVPRSGGLDGAIEWRGRIGDLWALVPLPGHVLDGAADMDLRVSGSLDAPVVSGRAEISGGQYQNLDSGTILTDMALHTMVGGDTLHFEVEATDGAKGRVTGTADLDLGGRAPRIDSAVQIDRATLVRRDDVTAELGGELTLSGPLSDLRLKGRIDIQRAEVRLVGGTPPELVELDGIVIKGQPAPETDGNGASRLTLDLSISAGQGIFVRGRGLDSEWKMDLAVTGDASAPAATGRIEKIRGQLDLLGRPFDLTRGRVTFDGGRKIDPQLDVAVERESNGVRGGITVSGRASSPELHFVATPPLPEDEVLPRLLFGRSKQSLSAAEAIQLAVGVATLVGGQKGPLDEIREAIGLDVLRIEGDTADDAQLTVGRNVGEGVFVGAKQGLGGQGTAVTVEVEVFDGVTVDTELGQQRGADVGITLRKDF